MNKLAQSEQFMAVADPQVMVLFEDWLEELEGEVISFIRKTGSFHPGGLAEKLGLSLSGTKFLLAKLQREGKV